MGFPGGASGQEPTCQSKSHKRHKFNTCIGKIPWRRAWRPTMPRESHGQRSLVWATVHRVTKSQTWLKRLSKQAYVCMCVCVCVCVHLVFFTRMGSSGGSDSEESTCNTGDLGSIPGSKRSPGEGHDNSLQYSFLENSVHSGTWQATVHGVAKSQTLLSD